MRKSENELKISFRISPNAKKNEIINENGIIKIKITAQPIDGKANKALIEFLSKTFKIPKTAINIVKGETSKEKTVCFQANDNDKIEQIRKTFQ